MARIPSSPSFQRKLESIFKVVKWIPAFAGMTLMGLMASAHAQAEPLAPIRSITVNGMAERKVVPDEAHLTVDLNAVAMKMGDAKSAHDAKLEKLLGIAKGEGIDSKKIRTQSTSVQPVYSYPQDPATHQSTRHFDGYRMSSSIDITVSDTDKLAPLLDKITSAELDKGNAPEWGNLVNMYYTISNPDKLRDELLAEAIANAKTKADNMSAAAGTAVGRVYEIREGGAPVFTPTPMPMMALAAAAPAMAKATMAPPAGEQQLQSSVTVTYELK